MMGVEPLMLLHRMGSPEVLHTGINHQCTWTLWGISINVC